MDMKIAKGVPQFGQQAKGAGAGAGVSDVHSLYSKGAEHLQSFFLRSPSDLLPLYENCFVEFMVNDNHSILHLSFFRSVLFPSSPLFLLLSLPLPSSFSIILRLYINHPSQKWHLTLFAADTLLLHNGSPFIRSSSSPFSLSLLPQNLNTPTSSVSDSISFERTITMPTPLTDPYYLVSLTCKMSIRLLL
jgi:hypothetical protein